MMRIIKILKHLLIVTGALFILVGVPLMMTDYWRGLLSSDEADAVSSPSVVIDKPSGNYIVLINTRLHTDKEKLNQWIDFFDGKETDIIFEDIACTVAEGDTMGIEMAESFRSKLPENQMKIKKEEAVLVVSRAEEGKFDVLLMSKEFADSYKLKEKNKAYIEDITISEEKKSG